MQHKWEDKAMQAGWLFTAKDAKDAKKKRSFASFAVKALADQ